MAPEWDVGRDQKVCRQTASDRNPAATQVSVSQGCCVLANERPLLAPAQHHRRSQGNAYSRPLHAMRPVVRMLASACHPDKRQTN